MMAAQNMAMDGSVEPSGADGSGDFQAPESGETPVLAEGEFACPSCGKGNAQGAYTCQHCGANLFE